MSNKFLEGEYVYIPSSAHLYQFGKSDTGYINRTCILQSPAYVVLLDSSQTARGYYNVFYEGQTWSVEATSVYSGEKI